MWATRRVVQALWKTRKGFPQGGISISLSVQFDLDRGNQVMGLWVGERRINKGEGY
jgi:hypothetical protein